MSVQAQWSESEYRKTLAARGINECAARLKQAQRALATYGGVGRYEDGTRACLEYAVVRWTDALRMAEAEYQRDRMQAKYGDVEGCP